MAKINVPTPSPRTHQGAIAQRLNPEEQLRRSVMACLLWEKEFYEDGQEISQRITTLVPEVKPLFAASLAIEAREKGKLRHAPLWIVRAMAQASPAHRSLVAQTLARVIQRTDELAEFIAMYWKDGKTPLSAQVKKGLAAAFTRFDAYQLAKYDRDGAVKLRDVAFLVHPKAVDAKSGVNLARLVNKTFYPEKTKSGFAVKQTYDLGGYESLTVPDTWEVSLSTGKDKKETWERLLREDKLGALALLRNLRNMSGVGVDEQLIFAGLARLNVKRVLPFRFITAARAMPQWEAQLEPAMMKCLTSQVKLPGRTILIVDVSGSMYGASLSGKSDLTRADAACALAILIRELCDTPRIFATAGNDATMVHATREVPARRSFALRDAVYALSLPLGGGGIFLKQVIDWVHGIIPECDRIIVITDEQDCDRVNSPLSAVPYGKHNYVINVASAQNGIAYGAWTHMDGFSESVIDYIRAKELESIPQSETGADGENQPQ